MEGEEEGGGRSRWEGGKVQALRRGLRLVFCMKTESGYATGVILLTLATPGNPLRCHTHRSVHLLQSPPSPIPRDLGRGPSHQSACSNIETRKDRPKSVVRVIRGVA